MIKTHYFNSYMYGNMRGFGDYIRTVFYNYCDAPNNSYDVIFSLGPLSDCFNPPEIVCDNFIKCNQEISKNPSGIVKVEEYKGRFVKYLESRLSPYVNELLYRFTKQYSNDFIAVHFRCGDQNISPYKNPDVRIKEVDAIKKLLVLKKHLGSDFNKCLLFTDSVKLKRLICEHEELYSLKMFEYDPVHVAYNHLLGRVEKRPYTYTIAEWFFMGNASEIYAVSTSDGHNRLSSFSLMCSYLYDKPFYYLDDHNKIIEGYTDDKLWAP